jgi:surface antigen
MLAKIALLPKIFIEPVSVWECRFPRQGTIAVLALGLLAPLLLSACASGNILEKAEVDKSLVTGSVASAQQASPLPQANPFSGTSPQAASDEMTIRNAVSTADLKVIGGKGISWANPATGSSGEISTVTEYRQDGILCRRFTTSRQSFDGVALYHGDACLDTTGAWQMLSFKTS